MKLVKSLSVYTLVNFLQQGIAFPLAILFSYYILPEEFALLSLFMLYISMLNIVMQVGAEGAMAVNFYKLSREDYKQYFSSAFVTPFLLFVFFQLLVLIFRKPLAILLSLPVMWVLLIPITSFAGFIPKLVLTLYRIKEKSIKYAYFNLSFTIITLALSIVFVIFLNLNWEGRAWGIFISNLLFFGLGLIVIHKSGFFTTQIKKKYAKDALHYGLPLIPHLIGTFVIGYSDRIFIEKMVSLEALGIYDMGYKIGALIMILVVSFSSAYVPFLYDSLRTPSARNNKKLALLAYGLLIVLAGALFVLTLLSPFVFKYLIDDKYLDGNQYVFWVGLGSLFYGGYALFTGFIHFSKKTYKLAILAIVNVGMNLILNYLLIKEYGAIGAAYATAISYAFIAIVLMFVTKKQHTIPYSDFKGNFQFLKSFLKEYRAANFNK